MKKQTIKEIKKVVGRIFLIAIMIVVLNFLTRLPEPIVPVFYWSLIMLMIINFWLHVRKEVKGDYRYFFMALGASAILFIINLLVLIGYIIQSPVFQGGWQKIFGWHGLVAMILIIVYALILFDKSCRDDLKCWFKNKINLTNKDMGQ